MDDELEDGRQRGTGADPPPGGDTGDTGDDGDAGGATDFDEEAFFRQMKLYILPSILVFVLGVTFAATAFTLEFTKFAPLLEELVALPKPVVDTAPPGSEIAAMKVQAAKFPPLLLTLKLVGIASILTGIFVLLFVIIQALKIMPVRLGLLLSELDS